MPVAEALKAARHFSTRPRIRAGFALASKRRLALSPGLAPKIMLPRYRLGGSLGGAKTLRALLSPTRASAKAMVWEVPSVQLRIPKETAWENIPVLPVKVIGTAWPPN